MGKDVSSRRRSLESRAAEDREPHFFCSGGGVPAGRLTASVRVMGGDSQAMNSGYGTGDTDDGGPP